MWMWKRKTAGLVPQRSWGQSKLECLEWGCMENQMSMFIANMMNPLCIKRGQINLTWWIDLFFLVASSSDRASLTITIAGKKSWSLIYTSEAINFQILRWTNYFLKRVFSFFLSFLYFKCDVGDFYPMQMRFLSFPAIKALFFIIERTS